MQQKKFLLPRAYQQVEYIKSTGKEYIDTGIISQPKFKMEVDFQFTCNYVNLNEKPTIGTVRSPARIALGYNSGVAGNNFYIAYGRGLLDTGIPFDIQRHKCMIQGLGGDSPIGLWDIDGTGGNTANLTNGIGTYEQDQGLSFILFARHNTTSSTNSTPVVGGFAKMKLFSFKFYENDLLIRDLLPCYRTSDNEVGLYDLVNGVFYTNKGQGKFEKGDNI